MLKLFWPHNWHWWDTLWGDLCCNILSSAKPPTVQSYVAPLIMCDVSYIIPSWCWHRVSVQTASQHTIFNFECSMNFHCHCIFYQQSVRFAHFLKFEDILFSCVLFLFSSFWNSWEILRASWYCWKSECTVVFVLHLCCFLCHRLSLWQIFIGQGFWW